MQNDSALFLEMEGVANRPVPLQRIYLLKFLDLGEFQYGKLDHEATSS
jgi:hypothetical protein